ncbi:ATP-binding protein [Aspergillus vadensis CBS 113365]|uniref:ATPase n=1 Tax=Aspergillus vadensis (strain CBS 113365 / IMI 142717 / IBT 24658) TaxID=1448311 RepID=A0A319BRE3_ASPVC|nr:ATPase [Aspergillus vadensis CBS 113365]PYH73720.1 ATPase [Aspergillus vadensis CBS 113365]
MISADLTEQNTGADMRVATVPDSIISNQMDLPLQSSNPRATESEDHSSQADKSNLNTIPRAAVEEWYKENRLSVYQFATLKTEADNIRQIRSYDWREMLDKISSTLSEEMHKLEQKESSPTYISIPKARYLPWGKAAKVRGHPSKQYLLEIPYNEPSASDIQLMASNYWDGIPHTEEDTDDGLPLTALPERICINPGGLSRFLNVHLCNKERNVHDNTGLMILRPFKLLVYLDKAIRSQMKELEFYRRQQEDLPEKAYIEALKTSPVDQMVLQIKAAERVALLDVPELTDLLLNFRCLTQWMDETLHPFQAQLAAIPEMVRFVDLWFLFSQGSLVYIKGSFAPQKIWKVVQRTGGRRYMGISERVKEQGIGTWAPLVLDCFYLDFDGSQFLPIFRQFKISGFDGTQAVRYLPILPLSIAQQEGLTDKQYLMTRGRQFVGCTREALHMDYSGRCHYLTPTGQKLTDLVDEIPRSASCYSEQIDSDVIVDFARAFDEIPSWRPTTGNHEFGKTDQAELGLVTGIDNDGVWDKRLTDDFMEAQTRMWESWARHGGGPSGEDLLILPDRVFAFVLSTRRWACLRIGRGPNEVEQLRQRETAGNPWLKLRLPNGHEELIQSLIHSHFARQKSRGVHFDLMRNKGNGVTILLHGVPGVGKTSTAECVAISSGRPLLPVTCGDLGLTAGEVEEKLKEILRLAQDWGCIMLLDEADVFLAQRRAYDIERNALVSVFLRTLEYYEGVLFLTTNRVGVFDEAFKSRIHMSLYYPPLNWQQTYEIWSGHIDEAGRAGIVVNKGELTSFANRIFNAQLRPGSGPVWNGRQIRNAFQSALALASYNTQGGSKIELSTTYFHKVFTVSDNFSRYIWTTQNMQDDADRNRDAMIRRDDFNSNPSEGLYSQPPQQGTTFQPAYPQGGILQSASSPFGNQSTQQMGGLGGGQTYMGNAQNFQASMQPMPNPLGQQLGQPFQQQQQLSSQSTLQPQFHMLSNSSNNSSYGLQQLQQQQPQQQQQHPSPQLALQPQTHVPNNNTNSDNLTLQQLQQQQQQPQQAQFLSQPGTMASLTQTTTSQAALPTFGQPFDHS